MTTELKIVGAACATLVVMLCALSQIETGVTACTPQIEKLIEEEGYMNSIRRKQQRACEEGSLDCDELRQYVSQVQSCISELTHW